MDEDEKYLKTRREANQFVKRNREYANQPIAFYYEDGAKFIVIDNNSFSCKELVFKTKKEAVKYCIKANEIQKF